MIGKILAIGLVFAALAAADVVTVYPSAVRYCCASVGCGGNPNGYGLFWSITAPLGQINSATLYTRDIWDGTNNDLSWYHVMKGCSNDVCSANCVLSGDNSGCTSILVSGTGAKWSGGWQSFDVTDRFTSPGATAIFFYGGVFHYICGAYAVFNFTTPNVPPSFPLLTSPNGGEVVDEGVLIEWIPAADNETPSANQTYDLDYSSDGGATWANVTQTGPGAESWWWNTTGLSEGAGYRVRARAFDGTDYGPFDSSGNNFTIRHFHPVFSNAIQAGFAAAGVPVEWAVAASGFGAGECNYSGLPPDRVGALQVANGSGTPFAFNSSGGWTAWDCNLTASNYSLSFFTPSPAVNEGAASIEGDWWLKNATLSGDAVRPLENVSFALTIPDFLVPGTEFLRVMSSGGWADLTPALGETDCDSAAPSLSSFLVDGLVWRACKKDVDGNGLFEYFRAMVSLVPAGSSFLVQAGGILPGGSGWPGGGGSGSGSGSGGANGSNSTSPSSLPSPSPSASPFPSPVANETSNETIVESTEEVNDTTEILGPSQVEPGLVSLGFLSGGGVGGGFAELFDPNGNKFSRQIGADGSLSFYFDVEGNWLVRYGNETKEILVKKTKVPAVQKTVLGGNETAVGGTTGLVVAGYESLAYGALLPLALGTALAWHVTQNRVRVSKRVDGGRVSVEVKAGKPLNDLVLTDLVPEGLEVGVFSKGMTRRDTVTGAALKWKKEALAKGEKWAIEYEIQNHDAIAGLGHAELKATDGKGLKVVALSNEIAG